MRTVSDLLIRQATRNDVSAVGHLGALLVQAHYAFDARRFIPADAQTPRHYASFLASQLDAPDVLMLVADDNGRIAGYAFGALEGFDYLALRGPAGVLHDLVVHLDYRGRGIGQNLVDAFVTEMKARGAPRVVLWTAEANAAAQQLFSRAGFRRTMVEMTRELDDTARPPA